MHLNTLNNFRHKISTYLSSSANYDENGELIIKLSYGHRRAYRRIQEGLIGFGIFIAFCSLKKLSNYF